MAESEKCTQEQSQRLSLLQESCQTLLQSKENFSHHLASQFPDVLHFWFNKPRGLTLCTPHKVGSQTWRYFFQRLEMKDKSGEVEQEEYYLEAWPSNTQNYLKAFQVRHPLERLLSSYRFVFERQQMRHTAQDLCKHIFYTYAKPENSSLEEYPGSDFLPTFRQFLQYVVDSGEDFDESKYVVVSHWKPYWLSCNPCHQGKSSGISNNRT